MTRPSVALLVLAIASAACAQEPEFLRDWNRAQQDRPRQLSSRARIAPESEPGTPLVIQGRVFRADGVTPAPDVVVFAYHTDRTGVYNTKGVRGWRLRGWAKSDAAGRFEFRTIRPGAYPSDRIPAHVHLSIEGPGISRQWAEEIRFDDDPFLTDANRRQSASKGTFGGVRPVTMRDGVQHVDFNIRENESRRF